MAIVNMWIFPLNFYCQTYEMRSNLHLINATVNNVAESKAMDKIHYKAKHNHRKDYSMLLAPSLCLNYFCGYGKKNEQPKKLTHARKAKRNNDKKKTIVPNVRKKKLEVIYVRCDLVVCCCDVISEMKAVAATVTEVARAARTVTAKDVYMFIISGS